jgi:NitT/TauT family transport system substrate-binding protein
MAKATVVILTLLSLLGGCRKEQSVRLGYFANLTHAQAVLGVSTGDFAKAVAPMKLNARSFNAGPALIEALLAGQIDIGYVGPGPAITAYGRSPQDIRIIAGASANGVLIVASADSGIGKIQDIKDRKIATPQLGNTQDISARHYLLNVLHQQDTKNIVTVSNAEQAGMMLRKQIDAAWVPEPWGSRLVAEAGAKIIAREDQLTQLWPDGQLTLAVVVTTPKFLAEHSDVVQKFLAAHHKWTVALTDDAAKHAPALGAAIRNITGQTLPPALLQDAIRNVRFTDDPLPQTLSTMAHWAYELKFAQKDTSIDGLMDLSIMRKVR